MTTPIHFCSNTFYGVTVFYCSFSAKVSQDLKQFGTSGKSDINGTTIRKEAVFPCVDIGGEKCHKHWPNRRRSRPLLQRGIASRNDQEVTMLANFGTD